MKKLYTTAEDIFAFVDQWNIGHFDTGETTFNGVLHHILGINDNIVSARWVNPENGLEEGFWFQRPKEPEVDEIDLFE